MNDRILESLFRELAQNRRLRWGVRAVLVLGIAASVAANILHALPDNISKSFAGWPPLALLLCIELVSRIPVTNMWRGLIRVSATAMVASIAGWISYWQMASVAAKYGDAGGSNYLFPLTVDGVIVVVSISLVELNVKIRSIQGQIRDREGDLQAMVEPQTVKELVNEAADRLPIPVSPAAQPAESRPQVVTSRMRGNRPSQRTGPQVSGPVMSPLTKRVLLEEPPQV